MSGNHMTLKKMFPILGDDNYDNEVNNRKYTIDTMINSGKTNYIDSFNAKTLLDRRRNKRKEKLKLYKTQLNRCFKLIDDNDIENKTYVIFKIDKKKPENKEYNSLQCLYYIQNKLQEKMFDTTLISDTKIFVSWENIESTIYDSHNNHTKND
jgi:hypothetical protein